MRVFWAVAACAFLAALGVSYLGFLHPAGDSLAVFRLPLAVLAGVAAVWTGWPRALRWSVAALCLGILAWHGSRALPHAAPPMPALTVYQKNMLYRMGDKTAFLADVADVSPDLITLQEVSAENRAVLSALRADYPSQAYCDFAGVGGDAVLSRLPKVEGSEICAEKDGLIAMQLEGPRGRFWLVSVHVHWPWPYGQAAHVSRLLPYLEGLDGPVILGGDFNSVAWSHTVARIEAATGSTRVGRHMSTFRLPRIGMGVGIDHVLAPGGIGQITRRGRVGSDHFGVVARVAVP